MGYYQGKATGNYVWGETPKGTTFVAVDVALTDDKGASAGVITHKFFFVLDNADNIRISMEGLRLLGARLMNGDLTDLYGLGSTTAGIVTQTTQFGEEVKYINPPGPRARGVKDEQKIGADKLAAFRARMMPVAAGIAASSGAPVAAPQPTASAPWQGQRRSQQAPPGGNPWDRQAPPATPSGQQPAQPGDDGDPWNQSDAYEGVDQPSELQQQVYAPPAGYGPPQQAAVGGPPRKFF